MANVFLRLEDEGLIFWAAFCVRIPWTKKQFLISGSYFMKNSALGVVVEIEILVPKRFTFRGCCSRVAASYGRYRIQTFGKTFELGINPICCAKVPNQELMEVGARVCGKSRFLLFSASRCMRKTQLLVIRRKQMANFHSR